MDNNNEITGLYKKLDKILGVLLDPLIAIVFALTVGAVIIKVMGGDVIYAYQSLWSGAFGNIRSIGQTLISTTPYIFTGLAFAFTFRCGLFNIGTEGQFYAGAIAGAWVGFAIPGLPPFFHSLLVIICGAIAGAAWAFLPGYLKARLEVHEVINTIMMNHIIIHLTNWLSGPGGPIGTAMMATPFVKDSARLARILPGSRLSSGIFVALICAFIVWVILWRTKLGFKIRAVGFNPFAAENAGINKMSGIIASMMISGALAGMGGAIEIIGVHGRFYAGFSPGYGFEGIAVALLGQKHPLGILLSALLFGALKSGAMTMQMMAGTNSQLVKILQALVIFFVAAKWGFPIIVRKWLRNEKREVVEGGEA